MKKVLVIFICLLMIVGCNKKNEPTPKPTPTNVEKLSMVELREELVKLSEELKEKKAYESYEVKDNIAFISIKDIGEKEGYDITHFKNGVNQSCDIEKSGVQFIIFQGVLETNIILDGCEKNENMSNNDVFLNDENADEGQKTYMRAQQKIYEYAEEIYKGKKYNSFKKVDGKYTITINELKDLGYDISMFSSYDLDKSKIEIDEDNTYNVKYDEYPIMCSLYNK